MIADIDDLSLKYRARIVDDRTAPLVIMVHGRAGDRSVMWAFRSTVPEEFHIISPQAFIHDEAGGFSWWNVNEANNYGSRELAFERLSSFISEVIEHHAIAPKKIVALGFSQGAGILSLFLSRDVTRFSGVGLLAGFIIRGEKPYSHGSELPPIFMAHGINDETIPVATAREAKDYLSTLGFNVEYHEDPVGHKVGSNGMRALKKWLTRYREIH